MFLVKTFFKVIYFVCVWNWARVEGAAFSIRSEKNYIGRSENFSLLLFPVLALIFLDYSLAAAEYMEANKTV